jgi:hypothetical protein
MPQTGPRSHRILFRLALPSGALGFPTLLARADDGGGQSPPRQATANDVAAALISILVIVAIISWLLYWLAGRGMAYRMGMYDYTTNSSSESSL